jgi:hypothetical protein
MALSFKQMLRSIEHNRESRKKYKLEERGS